MNLRAAQKSMITRLEQFRYKITGLVLIGAGLLILLDQTLQTGWLSLLVMPGLALAALVTGFRSRRPGWAIPGALVGGLAWGGFFLLTRLLDLPQLLRLGLLIACVGAGFLAAFVATVWIGKWVAHWALVPAMVCIGASLPLILHRPTVFDFVLYVGSGLGISLLAWGGLRRLFGLIIPGCLLVGIAPGIFFGWAKGGMFNGLTETGIMLVWFALGWGLITIASRLISDRFVWWPLIPGGLLAVGGWGLYIGGDPGNALSFIGNTGSIGLIIFGLYLFLLRRGFKD